MYVLPKHIHVRSEGHTCASEGDIGASEGCPTCASARWYCRASEGPHMPSSFRLGIPFANEPPNGYLFAPAPCVRRPTEAWVPPYLSYMKQFSARRAGRFWPVLWECLGLRPAAAQQLGGRTVFPFLDLPPSAHLAALGGMSPLDPHRRPHYALRQPRPAERRHGRPPGPELRGLRGRHQAEHRRLRLQYREGRPLWYWVSPTSTTAASRATTRPATASAPSA